MCDLVIIFHKGTGNSVSNKHGTETVLDYIGVMRVRSCGKVGGRLLLGR